MNGKIILIRVSKNSLGFFTYWNGTEYLKFTNRKKYISALCKHEKKLNDSFDFFKFRTSQLTYEVSNKTILNIQSRVETIKIVLRHISYPTVNSCYILTNILIHG